MALLVHEPQGPTVVDWRPGKSMAAAWTVLGAAAIFLGLGVFALPLILQAGPAGGSFAVRPIDIVLVVALTLLLVVAHEAIHGVVMHVLGARPQFGVVLVGGVVPAVYATAEGHRFSRRQYVIVSASPAVSVSVVGFLACLGPLAGYLIVPLAVHLGGCVGDAFACWRTLSETSRHDL
jgi:hypothetical protein